MKNTVKYQLESSRFRYIYLYSIDKFKKKIQILKNIIHKQEKSSNRDPCFIQKYNIFFKKPVLVIVNPF